jgi:hypothetical protein
MFQNLNNLKLSHNYAKYQTGKKKTTQTGEYAL